jgi:hypothetical protein
MKNLIGRLCFTALFCLVLVGMLFVNNTRVYASQGSGVVTVQNQGTSSAAEVELNNLQKRLITLLDIRLAMLQTEWRLMVEQKIRNLQLELVGLLQKQVALLQMQVVAGK